MNKEEALQQLSLLEDMEELLHQYQELAEEMLKEVTTRNPSTNG